MAAAVELDGGLKGDLRCNVVGGDGGCIRFGGGVEVVYIRLVVFAMVKFHNLG